ncbi:MAG: UDP-2,3-diacylglucosamine diphosphatase [Parvibaculum sp.]|uniref:UDP-2,3-diacylglucosamine diphosphatase n=1 Tax=Parvibaculum sp. TaxID=2024848 RepID=UPI003C70711E
MMLRDTRWTRLSSALPFRMAGRVHPAITETGAKRPPRKRDQSRNATRRRGGLDERLTGPRPKNRRKHRTLFLSDIHLGTPGCKADLLLDFLRHNDAETIYLVGDIIDGWRLKRSWYWTAAHNAVVQELLRKARKGAAIIYIPGNHDEALRDYTGLNFGGADIMGEAIHETADGRRFLVIHGDQFDSVVKYAKWLAHLGDRAYGAALALNNWLHEIRRLFGLPYWSLSSYLKHRVKNAVEYISSYEAAVARSARERGVDGVICGHIHHAEIRAMDGVLYCNDGDWVESCTALAEDEEGTLSIITWHRFSWESGLAGSDALESEGRRVLNAA